MAEKQCISTLHCYNNNDAPPDYVMECSGSWGNNKKPLQRLAGVGRTVGSQGSTPTMMEPVARCQSDNEQDNNVNEERRRPPKQMTLVVMRGFDSEIETNNSGRNIALKTMKQGSDRNIGSCPQHQQQQWFWSNLHTPTKMQKLQEWMQHQMKS